MERRGGGNRPGGSGVRLTGAASVGWTATASVGLTSAAGVAVATAALGLVAVGGNRTMSGTWTMPLLAAMSAPVTLDHGDRICVGYGQVDVGAVEGLDRAGDDI